MSSKEYAKMKAVTLVALTTINGQKGMKKMNKVQMQELRTKKVLTEEQIAMFNELLNNEEFKGKKSLRYLLWLNTVAPKFEVGDTVLINADGSQRIWERPVRRAVGKVKEVRAWKDIIGYHYTIECTFEKDGKQYTTTVCGCEENITTIDEFKVNTDWS